MDETLDQIIRSKTHFINLMTEVGFAVQLREFSPWAKEQITYTSSTMVDKKKWQDNIKMDHGNRGYELKWLQAVSNGGL